MMGAFALQRPRGAHSESSQDSRPISTGEGVISETQTGLEAKIPQTYEPPGVQAEVCA